MNQHLLDTHLLVAGTVLGAGGVNMAVGLSLRLWAEGGWRQPVRMYKRDMPHIISAR